MVNEVRHEIDLLISNTAQHQNTFILTADNAE